MGDSHSGKLVVCATPIGNLADASPRLAKALAEADLIACEDTRQTRKLLAHLGVRARLLSYHDANESSRAAQIAGEIAGGAHVALVSDAGMPGVSDPGHDLIGACLARGLPVEVVPGPSAVLAALVLSGLPADRFCFEGFLPRRPGPRDRRLAELAGERRTMVFFEAPHPELAARLEAQGPRGELTLVVGGAPERAADAAGLVAEVERLVGEGATTKDAVGAVATRAGAPRRALYQAVLDARSAAPAPARRPGASLPTGGSLAGTVLPAPPSRSSGSLESP